MDRTDCSVYGKDYVCTEEFREWATTNCPRFCGLCGGIVILEYIKFQNEIGRPLKSVIKALYIKNLDKMLYVLKDFDEF